MVSVVPQTKKKASLYIRIVDTFKCTELSGFNIWDNIVHWRYLFCSLSEISKAFVFFSFCHSSWTKIEQPLWISYVLAWFSSFNPSTEFKHILQFQEKVLMYPANLSWKLKRRFMKKLLCKEERFLYFYFWIQHLKI